MKGGGHSNVKSKKNNDSGEEVTAKRLGCKVSLGDVIWVNFQGSSWWPAQVVDENAVSEVNKPGNKSVGDVLVRLYGSYNYVFVDPVKSHSEFEIVLKQNSGCYLEIFQKSLEQECTSARSGRTKGQGLKQTEVGGSGDKKSNHNQASRKRVSHNAGTDLEKPGSEAFDESGIRRNVKRKCRSADEEGKNKNFEQDRGQKKLRQSSQIDEEEVKPRKTVEEDLKSENSKQSSMQKKFKPNSPRPKKEGKSPNQKQDSMQRKVKPDNKSAEGRSSKTPKPEMQKKVKANSVSTEEDATNKSPMKNKEQGTAEKSKRRVRVMQNLGLAAPSGSPFNKK